MGRGDPPALSGLTLTRGQWESMRAHVESQLPREACGLLAGRNDLVAQVLPVANRAPGLRLFEMDPAGQLQAFAQIESAGLELLGIFHSHPAGPETISRTDIEQAAYPVVQLIWSPSDAGWTARAFRIEAGQAREVALKVVAGE
jgi:proteasome lid subunit RPN8/RPN11